MEKPLTKLRVQCHMLGAWTLFLKRSSGVFAKESIDQNHSFVSGRKQSWGTLQAQGRDTRHGCINSGLAWVFLRVERQVLSSSTFKLDGSLSLGEPSEVPWSV